MSNELELECINKIKFFASSIYNYGYSIKLKFLKAKEIDINLLPEDQLKDRLNFVFFNLFEDLLQNGGCFDFEELECISKVFGISINSFVNFMCDFANLSTELLNKNYSERSQKEMVEVETLKVSMKKFKMNMLNFILTSLMRIAKDIMDEKINELCLDDYGNIFVIEPLLFGGR